MANVDKKLKKPSFKKPMPDEPDENFSSPWKLSDVVLIVDDNSNQSKDESTKQKKRKLHVHSTILYCNSKVFDEMLKSSTTKKSKQIELKGKEFCDILQLVRILYPQYESELEKLSLEKLDKMLELCEEYNLENLQKKIVERCINMTENLVGQCVKIDKEALLDLFKFADKHKINKPMNILASHMVMLYDSTYSDHIFTNTISIKEACESKWGIGNHGIVKIMACMTEKHANSLRENSTGIDTNNLIEEIIDMQRFILELEIK